MLRRLYLSLLPGLIAFACTPRQDELEKRHARLENRPSRVEAKTEETVRGIKERLAEREPALVNDRREIMDHRDLDGAHDARVVERLRETSFFLSLTAEDENGDHRDLSKLLAPREVLGEVRAANAGQVIVATDSGHDLTLRANPSTEVSVLGVPVRYDEFIEPGAVVRASYSIDPEGPIASSITVLQSASETAE